MSINRPSAIRAIYGPPTRTTRSPWYSQMSSDVTKTSVNSTRDPVIHRQRKKVWERGLGQQGTCLPKYKRASARLLFTDVLTVLDSVHSFGRLRSAGRGKDGFAAVADRVECKHRNPAGHDAVCHVLRIRRDGRRWYMCTITSANVSDFF